MISKTGPPIPSEVLGVPRVPPARLTGALNALRDWIGWVHSAVAPPPVQILEALFGVLDHRVLVLLCRAGIPDALRSPMSLDDLARQVGANAERLEQIVRFAAARGWLRLDRRGRVRPTRVTEFLRTDHPGGWQAWVQFAGGDEIVDAVKCLDLRAGDTFAAANGESFFPWMQHHPQRWAAFDEAMSAGARLHALTIRRAIDWASVRTVCDVGGGAGELLIGLLELEPTLQGIVFDLPEVITRVHSHPRLTALGGDAFVSIPAGCDVYLLVNVIHDWNDHDASKILANIAIAATKDSRILVVENDHPRKPRRDIATSSDVFMAALTNGGKERNQRAIRSLAENSGLRLTSSNPLASGDVVHHLTKK
ncbi:MAG: methyltransferase [Ilumatobacteraceae bacterium]